MAKVVWTVSVNSAIKDEKVRKKWFLLLLQLQ